MTTVWGFRSLLVLLALAAWPYLAAGPLWLVIPALAAPMALGRWTPAAGLGILLGLAPLVDGLVSWLLLGSPEHGGRVGMASWIEPACIGFAAGMVLRLPTSPPSSPARLPGLALFIFAAGSSFLLAVARLAPDWQEQLPWFGLMAWMSLPDPSPWVMEHSLRATFLLMAGAGWFALLRRVLPRAEDFVPAASGWLVGSLITGIQGTWTWASGRDPHWPFSAGLLEDKNSYGSYLVLTLFVAAALWWFRGDLRLRSLSLAGFLMAGWMLLLSGSKAALAATAAAALYVALDSLARQTGRAALRLVPVLLLAGLLAAWGSQVLLPQRVSLTLLRVTTPSFMTDYLVAKRLPVWSAAAGAWIEHPVLGLGPGLLWSNLGRYHDGDRDGWQPQRENAHNQFLQLAAETGTAGLVGFLLLLGAPLRRALRSGTTALAAPRLMALGLLAYLGTALTGHPLVLSRQVVLFWSAVALMVMLSHGGPRKKPAGRIQPASPADRRRPWRPGAALATLILLMALMVQPFRRPCSPAPAGSEGSVPQFTAGFHPPEQDETSRWRWMKSVAEVRLCHEPGHGSGTPLTLDVASFQQERTLKVQGSGLSRTTLTVPPWRTLLTLPGDSRDRATATSYILRPHPGARSSAVPRPGRDRRRLSLQIFQPRSHDPGTDAGPNPAAGPS